MQPRKPGIPTASSPPEEVTFTRLDLTRHQTQKLSWQADKEVERLTILHIKFIYYYYNYILLLSHAFA